MSADTPHTETIPSETKKQRSLRTMARRLTSFIRLFSVADRHHSRKGCDPATIDSRSASLNNQAVCARCRRRVSESVLPDLETRRRQMSGGGNGLCIEEEASEEELESKDFTTGVLAGRENGNFSMEFMESEVAKRF